MDWNLKPPHSWDFTELEQEPFSSFNTVSGPHGLGDHKPIRADFSVDLKLGQVGNSGNDYMVDSWNKNPGPAKPTSSSSSSGPAKRSRGAYGGLQAVSCLVDGCEADLSGCRDYHRRHKVCELHSKTAQVSIAGLKQRFCQQCSRFHSLEEFDEGKRSCRKRLDGHNRRRRKPQPEPFSRYGSLFSNYTGTQMLPFSSSLVYPSTAVAGPSWGGISVKTEPDSGLPSRPPVALPFLHNHKQTMFLNPSSPGDHKFPNDKHFSLSQGPLVGPTDPDTDTDPHLSLLRTFPFPQSGANNRLPSQQQVLQSSDCALSLLSSPQGLGHVDVPMQLSSVALEPLTGSGSGSALHCPAGMFHGHLGSDGITNEESSHQTLPSHWG